MCWKCYRFTCDFSQVKSIAIYFIHLIHMLQSLSTHCDICNRLIFLWIFKANFTTVNVAGVKSTVKLEQNPHV